MLETNVASSSKAESCVDTSSARPSIPSLLIRILRLDSALSVLIETLWNVKTYETTGGYLKVLY